MKQKDDFFRDEIRSGFYVPTVIKQAWANELDVLEKIDEICKKYDIKYFADAGTLLGAVRHNGFIPWDDDIDICMFRDDFERFMEIAEKELPKDYTIHDYKRKENYNNFSVKIVNGQRINFELDYLNKHYNFPWLSCVDVYILDYLYEDSEQEKQRDDELLYLLAVIEILEKREELTDKDLFLLEQLEQKYNVKFLRQGSKLDITNQIRDLFVKISSRVNKNESSRVGIIHPFILSGEEGVSAELYKNVVYFPFEKFKIPVPIGYDDILKNRFNDYHIIVKDRSLHNYPFFEEQKKEIEQLADDKVFDFEIDKNLLLNRPVVDFSRCEREVENIEKKEILFLPIGIKEWESMQPYYEKAKRDKNSDVYIVPLPLMRKDILGNVIADDKDIFEALNIEAYIQSHSIKVEDIVSFIDYDISKHCPNEVYVHNPYDGENPYFTVPTNYYVKNIRNYASKITYIPIGKVDEFEIDDYVEYYNMVHYVCKPGLVYADEVIVQSENMKEVYIKKLNDIFGKEYDKAWNKMIKF
ncbi:LicD family protein [Lachnobacterium bovis]|uniref:LicD family protein n=1 Tax=Lachnobacterium bovis TaxID=140626 RepID=UPI0003B78ED7|nr:LicD family protein [Lachnobacterium bovis]